MHVTCTLACTYWCSIWKLRWPRNQSARKDWWALHVDTSYACRKRQKRATHAITSGSKSTDEMGILEWQCLSFNIILTYSKLPSFTSQPHRSTFTCTTLSIGHYTCTHSVWASIPFTAECLRSEYRMPLYRGHCKLPIHTALHRAAKTRVARKTQA